MNRSPRRASPIFRSSPSLELWHPVPRLARTLHPVNPERVFTRNRVYRFPETGSRTGNQRISATVSPASGRTAACGANAAFKRILRLMV